jgi:acetylornithine deacetylase/succinyl-diaminopimelate desuccinylase-like protein
MTIEAAQSSGSQPVSTGAVSTVLRFFVEIGAGIKAFFRGSHPASAGSCTENAAVETEAVAPAQIPAHAEAEADARISPNADNELGRQEIERRRNLVRTLFNDFWSGEDQKPASFTVRLDQAEDYLNERLAANGETWRLDTETRAMLSLPPRSSSPD